MTYLRYQNVKYMYMYLPRMRDALHVDIPDTDWHRPHTSSYRQYGRILRIFTFIMQLLPLHHWIWTRLDLDPYTYVWGSIRADVIRCHVYRSVALRRSVDAAVSVLSCRPRRRGKR